MFVRKTFKRRRKSDISNRIRTFNLIGDKRDKYLEGEITTGHCRGHNTIIIFFHFKVFTSSTWGFYRKIFIFTSHGLLFFFDRQRKPPKIEIVDETPPGQQYHYLRLEGKIIVSIDTVYDVPRIEIAFDGWYVNSVRLWPRDKKIRPHFSMLERSPPVSPQISLSDESVINTVF